MPEKSTSGVDQGWLTTQAKRSNMAWQPGIFSTVLVPAFVAYVAWPMGMKYSALTFSLVCDRLLRLGRLLLLPTFRRDSDASSA